MDNNGFVTAINIGTSKVSTLLGRNTPDGILEILGQSSAPHTGMKKGFIVDPASIKKSVTKTVGLVEKQSGVSIRSAWVGVKGAHINSHQGRYPMHWAGEHGAITSEDLSRVVTELSSIDLGEDRKLIHILPGGYVVDGQAGIANPEGMHANEIEVDARFITGDAVEIKQMAKLVEESGTQVDGLVLEPLATSEAILNQSDKENGSAVIEIGEGTTDLVVFDRGSITHTASIPVGGYQFTNDICLTYGSSVTTSEKIKTTDGHTEPYVVKADEDISLQVDGHSTPLEIPRRDICQLMRERAHELAQLVMLKLREAKVDQISNFTVILTGGGSNLPGLDQLMKRTMSVRVRSGMPDENLNLPDRLCSPDNSSVVGILLWASRQSQENLLPRNTKIELISALNGSGMVRKIFKQVKTIVAA